MWWRRKPPTVAVVRLHGVIGPGGPLRRGLSIASTAATIERAFSGPVDAVALSINSPGGSPVQSALIARRIRDLATEKSMPVYAFAEDVAASGGYWLLCAGDEIYVDPSSIVGSIGVVYASFGLQDLIARYGVERRVHTAGSRKVILDAFTEEKDEDVAKLRAVQSVIHRNFIDYVKARRGDRLNGDDDTFFSGEFWTGRDAVTYGLADGIGDLRSKMREIYGDKVNLRPVRVERGWFQRQLRQETARGADFGDLAGQMVAAVEERLLWGRFGL